MRHRNGPCWITDMKSSKIREASNASIIQLVHLKIEICGAIKRSGKCCNSVSSESNMMELSHSFRNGNLKSHRRCHVGMQPQIALWWCMTPIMGAYVARTSCLATGTAVQCAAANVRFKPEAVIGPLFASLVSCQWSAYSVPLSMSHHPGNAASDLKMT